VPGVTSVLARLGYMTKVPQHILDEALARGTRVHTACELDDLGDLDEASASDVMGYVAGWRKFIDERRPHWQHIERAMFHPKLHYAGKPDRLGKWLVDIKSGPWHPVMAAQLAAYGQISKESLGIWPDVHATVHVTKDGGYTMRELSAAELTEGWTLFVSLLSVHNWSMRHL
jgi:hypothetical protein